MKRIIALILAFCLLLCACGEKQVEQQDIAADELARAVADYLGESISELQNINSEYQAAALENFIEAYYSLPGEAYDDCAIYRKGGVEAFEISVFRLTESVDTDSVESCLEDYRIGRQGDFFGYAPEQADIVGKSVVCVYGGYASVLICENTSGALSAFKAAIDGVQLQEITPTKEAVTASGQDNTEFEVPGHWAEFDPPGIDDMSIWDSSAVVAAVKAGSNSGLGEKERKLYAKTLEVLEEIICDGMSELEKEWAVYSWLTTNAKYDYRHYEIPNSAPRESYEPYGAIVDGTAVCLGFATAFQLFMDILEIECITVVGAAFNSHEDHAWNMVRIDDTWYCVDATWDTSNGVAMENCLYFNVSSEWMAITDHQWDYENVPVAVSERDGSYQLYVPVS